MMARANSTYFKSTAENLSLGNAMVTFAISMTVRRLTRLVLVSRSCQDFGDVKITKNRKE